MPLKKVKKQRLALHGLFALVVLLVPQLAGAHAIGENYVFLNFREASIDGRFEFNFTDLKDKLGIDLEAGETSPEQAVKATADRVQAYILDRFSIAPPDGAPYQLVFTDQTVLSEQGAFAQYHFRADTGPLPDRLQIRHEMCYEDDRFHRGLVLVNHNAKTGTQFSDEHVAMVFGPHYTEQTLDLLDIPELMRARDMVWQGVLHIWIGIDHILFLVALILPVLLVRRGADWQPAPEFTGALFELLKIVTVFTVAHSLTLLLAALGFVNLPSRLVESMIALSIVLVAANNLRYTVREGSRLVILFLGLFHGLGFASVMGALPFRMDNLLKTVVAFNIGVELGQIAIVAVLFPLLFALRRTAFYVPVVLKGGSVALILVASFWFIQRAFGLD